MRDSDLVILIISGYMGVLYPTLLLLTLNILV